MACVNATHVVAIMDRVEEAAVDVEGTIESRSDKMQYLEEVGRCGWHVER